MSQEKTNVVEAEDTSDVSFVSRWSRLKHEAARDAETTAGENIKSNNTAAENIEHEIHRDTSTRILTDEDMPELESLTPDSVYADFLSPGVSEKLRKLALRKLFHGEAFNIRDGLDEYDGDYTQFEKLGDIMTSDMQHQLELEAQRKAQQLLQNEDQSIDATRIDDMEVNNNSDECDDENTGIAVNTANKSGQPDAVQQSIEAENDNEAVNDTKSDEKAVLISE